MVNTINYVYLDTETTGLFPGEDEIVEIAIIDNNGNDLINTLVKPVRNKSWTYAQGIHGITPLMVANAPTLDSLKDKIISVLKDKTCVIYNANFDVGFLSDCFNDSTEIACCMLDYAEEIGEWNEYREDYKWHKLINAASHVKHVWSGKAHRAKADTLACKSVWEYLKK
ncbi:MAG: DNA polymerase-3 subunit epsilon [Psychroserpens sp.]|jgi:DNA polymerase-3 subunit epsilon